MNLKSRSGTAAEFMNASNQGTIADDGSGHNCVVNECQAPLSFFIGVVGVSCVK